MRHNETAPETQPLSIENSKDFAEHEPDPVTPIECKLTILGELKDTNGEGYSRDIGRSIQLAGHTFYIFGDTFCKFRGEFVGLTNNTVANVHDIDQPLKSTYHHLHYEGRVLPLIPHTLWELGQVANKQCVRFSHWIFGGALPTAPKNGLVWYEKTVWYEDNRAEYLGMGVASLSVSEDGIIKQDEVERNDSVVFGPSEPRIGSFNVLLLLPFIYLWGHNHEHHIVLARVSPNHARDRNAYCFWNGQAWTSDWTKAVPVLKDMQHGQIFRSDLFGSENPWVFVGCNRWADSQIQVGCAKSLIGPWKLMAVAQAPASSPYQRYRYCMYPHPWAKGDGLMVTWSEPWPGGVVAARLEFKDAEKEAGKMS